MISLIVAMSKGHAIGKDNKLLWHLSDDLKNFKKVTSNKPIVMGRKTYESIGRPLPNRENIVLSKNKDLKIEGCKVYSSFDQVLNDYKKAPEVVVIGGGFVYNLAIDLVHKMYITHVDTEVDGDTFFPKFDYSKFTVVNTHSHLKDEKNEYNWEFREYRRI